MFTLSAGSNIDQYLARTKSSKKSKWICKSKKDLVRKCSARGQLLSMHGRLSTNKPFYFTTFTREVCKWRGANANPQGSQGQ